MAFMGLLLVGVLLCVLAVSVITLIISSVLLIIACKKEKTSKVFHVLKYICIPVLIISGMPVLAAIGFAGFGIHSLTIVPEGYIDCEKITYTDYGFATGNHTEFVKLDFRPTEYLWEHEGEPVFSYAPAGRYERASWHNIYKTDTDIGIPLYYERDPNTSAFQFYAERSRAEELCSYYQSHYYWSDFSFADRRNELPEEITEIIEKYKGREDYSLLGYTYDINLYAISTDGKLCVYAYYFIINDTPPAIVVKAEYKGHGYFYGFLLTEEEARTVTDYFQ